MEEMVDEDGPLVYAAFHIPCYNHNCPPEKSTTYQKACTTFWCMDWNLQTGYDWITFVFLSAVIICSFIGIAMIVGTLFVRECKINKWYLRRPLNHFLLVLLTSDILMTLIVIPIHMYDLLGGEDKLNLLRPGTCVFRICTHFMSVSAKSWSFVGYIVLYHLHDGEIPTIKSVIIGVWSGIVAILISVPGVIFGIDSYIDTRTCALIPDSANWEMISYITIIPFILPSCILTPVLIKWSNLTNNLRKERNISSEYLAQYDYEEDTENQNIASKYYERRSKEHSVLLGGCKTSAEVPVISVDMVDSEADSTELPNLSNSLNSSITNITVQFKEDIYKSNSLIVPMHTRINSFSRASEGTLNFLCQDKNFPRIIFIFSLVHIALWAPFFISLILNSLIKWDNIINDGDEVFRSVSLVTLWLGYMETAITPVLIYLLSTFVHKIVNQICSDICPCGAKGRKLDLEPVEILQESTSNSM